MIGGLGVHLEKSLEVDTGSELTEEYLQVTLTNWSWILWHLFLLGWNPPCEEPEQTKVCQTKGSKQGWGQEDYQDPRQSIFVVLITIRLLKMA